MNNEIKNLYLLHNFKASRSEKETLINNESFDWDGAILAAKKTGLLNTLYDEARRMKSFVPENKLSLLKRGYLFTLSKNIKKSREIIKLCKAMNGADIDFVIIQGWPLIFSVYSDFGLRDCIDVDIYVPKKDTESCIRSLVASGYTSHAMKKASAKDQLRREHINFSKPGGVLVELTDDPFKLFAPIRNGARFLRESKTEEIDGVSVRIPSFEYLLLGLIVHLQREGLSHTAKIYDIAYLIYKSGDKMDWGKFLEIVSEERLEVPVYYSLIIAKKLFSPPVPESALERLEPDERKKRLFLRLCRNNMVLLDKENKTKGRNPSEDRSFYLYAWLTRNSLIEKIKYPILKLLNPFGNILKFAPNDKKSRLSVILHYIKVLFTDRVVRYISLLRRL